MESGYMFMDRKIQDATSYNLINNFFLNPNDRKEEKVQ